MERNRKPPQYSPVDFKPKNRINVLPNNPLPNNHIAPNRNIQSSYQNKNRSRSLSISSRQSNNSDEEVLDDYDSSDETNSLSSNASSINETNNKKTDFLLLITDNIQKPYSNLTSYVEKEKMSIHQMFNKDFLTGINKIQYQDEKNRKRQFEKKSEPYEQEQTLIYKNISSFLKEMQRLSKNPSKNSYLRNAYDREFRRARAKLPFYAFRHTIIEELEKNDMLIIIGHTGSGKTTQVPQYLLEAGYRKIVCTQPRKIASISVCKRIAFELDCEHTNIVDFKTVRTYLTKEELEKRKKFNHKDNKLLLMTDRLLLQEYKKDNLLRKYSCIIIDEAHERTLFTDILLCELKKLVPKRRLMKNPLKLIIMSATIDEAKISNYLNSCKVVTVPGQLYPVKVYYEKIEQDYVSQSIRKIENLIKSNKLTGHVLVFLASIDDLKKAQNKLKIDNNKYSVMILHGNMNIDEQSKVFDESNGKIKIIFTTNVAETSITINGVKVIIDSGRVKQKVYDQDRNISILKLKFINQSSAQQRKGRAGRMQSGECYRLYELKDLENMEFSCEPEILRIHLGIVVLELLSFGVDNIIEYDLIDKPDRNDIIKSIKKLESLGFVENDTITETGRIAADLGLEPMISRMIIEGINLGIGLYMIKIAAMLTITNILYKKDLTKDEKNQKKFQNSNTKGDLFTLLSIYNQFDENKFKKAQYNWCNANGYYFNALKFAKQTYGELYNLIKTRIDKNIIFDQTKKDDLILKAICSGLHLQLAYFNGVVNRQNVYKLYELNQEVFIHNESVLNVLSNSDIGSFVLYTELNQHDRLYIKNLTPISHELLSQYSRFDLDKLKKESKKELLITNINIQVIEKIKGNNSEMQQQIEELIGSVLIVNKDSIKTYVSMHNFSYAKKILEEYIDKAKQMLKNELFEFKPKDCLKSNRVIFKYGLDVQTILFEKEFIRVNFKTSSGFSHDSLKRLFEKNGHVIYFNSNKISANKINGFVVFGNYKCAKQAYENLNGFVENNSILSLQPCLEIHDDEFKLSSRQKTITAYWYLTEPTGIAFLTFNNKSGGLELIKETLRNLNYLFRPEIIDENQIKIHNVTQLDRYLDEAGFKNLFKRYLPELENCSFIRKKEENLGSIDIESLQMQTILIQSLFSKFGEIEDLTMKPFHVSKKGTLKPQTTVIVKYKEQNSVIEAYNELNDKLIPENINGYGRMHIETNFIYEFRIPTKASKILNLNSLMNQLKESSKFSFDFRENFDKKDNDLFIVKSIDQNSLDKMVKHLNKIIKPASIKLPYFKYDKIRKYLNSSKKQSTLEEDNHIFIHKNQKLNQISIYGQPEISKKILEDLLKEIENLDSKKIEINVRSFKAIIGENGKTYKDLCEKFHGEIQLDYKNKKIIFTSKESKIEEFKNKIDEIQNQYLKTQKIDCLICQSSLESPFQLITCGHTFCKECLKGQILNYSSSCIICDEEFCISEIRTILDNSTSDLDDVCSKALNKFIICNAIFKYCDECNEIFCRERPEETYCKPCDEKITKEKRQMEIILSENFIASSFKKCPGCNLHIEKNHGCNHMTCFVCKTHFCWLCLFRGNNSEVIYQHLNEVHGGIFEIPLDLA